MSPSPPRPPPERDIDPTRSWAPTHAFMRFAVSVLLFGAGASLLVTKVFSPEQTIRIVAQALLVATALVAWAYGARGGALVDQQFVRSCAGRDAPRRAGAGGGVLGCGGIGAAGGAKPRLLQVI